MQWFNPFEGLPPGGGGGGGEGNTTILYGTTSYWNNSQLVSQVDTIYVYTDYTTVDGKMTPAIKIGDGNAYIVDLPFLVGSISSVTQQDIENWNNKVTAKIDPNNNENLILTTL